MSYQRKHKNLNWRCEASPENDSKLAPLQPQSPAGQLLAELLKSHPHLFPAAAEQQLEQLLLEREDEEAKERAKQESASGTDLVLHKRIAEVREAERRRAIEEVMYALIVQRFRETGADMVPKVPFIAIESLNPFSLVATLSPAMDKELLSVHSEEAKEMVREHLAMILGGKQDSVQGFSEDKVVIQTDKLRMGQVYAASIMYGYFLRRVDLRYQLEKTMASLKSADSIWDAFEPSQSPEGGQGKGSGEGKEEGKNEESPLRQYVKSFDPETLQKTAALRSREGFSVIERQTEALFGRPQMEVSPDGGASVPRVEPVGVTLTTLKRVVLEAVAFGSFLWDVESYVDGRYGISQSEL